MSKTSSRRALWIATILGWAPLVALLLGMQVAGALGCRVDEGSVHPCLVAGFDVGPLLYRSFVAGWLVLGLWPVMLATAAIWLGVGVAALVRRVRRPRVG